MLKIRSKITLLVVLPLTAIFAFAALAVVTTGGEVVRADQLRAMVGINSRIGDLVSALQAERSAAVRKLTDGEDGDGRDGFRERVEETEAAAERFHTEWSKADSLPVEIGGILDEASANLDRLVSTRGKVTNGTQTSAAVAFSYRIPIADLLEFRESVPQAGGASSRVGDMIRASTMLMQSGEYQSLADVAVLRAIGKGELSDLHYAQIVEASSASGEMRASFSALAGQEWRGWLERSRTGDEMIAAQALEYEAAGYTPGDEVAIDKKAWVDRIDYQAGKLRGVQSRIDGDIEDEVSQVRTEQLWWTGGQIAAVVVTSILMVLLAMRLGGPVVRGLRELSRAARHVASDGLPKAVARLDDHEELGDRTPEEFAKGVDPPIEVRGTDELADVGRAFNEVHEEAVRVAAAQALLRFHIAAMFVRLARRGHSLAGRLTSVLDDAERIEADPRRLDQLFELDHLVTLFGRVNDSLLVLGGATSSKVRRNNETVANVLTAAQGQIEQYTRVTLGNSDTGVAIRAEAVDDFVKVLAELLDNATQYSRGQVKISGWKLTDRLIIQVTDNGIGIEPEAMRHLNARLASKSALDLESVQTMGLTVVGHLAARYDLTVVLRDNLGGGTLAEVAVPPQWLADPNEEPLQPSAPEDEPKPPSLFDKTKKAENRRRNAAAWHNRSTSPTPAAAAPQPAAPQATASGASLGALLLPVIHFDSETGEIPVVRARGDRTGEMPVVGRKPRPQPKRPPLFQPESTHGEPAVAGAGWSSAQAAAETAMRAGASSGGLPTREPMAQLVPGAVETRTEDPAHVMRRPEAVSATYVAFARGRASGRIENAATESARGAQ